MAAGGGARQRALARGDRRAGGARFHPRSHPQHLRGQPRSDARLSRRMARPVHAAGALAVLPAQPHRPRFLLVLVVDRARVRLARELPAVDGFLKRLQDAGGRVTVGTDSGYIFQLYGFAFVREWTAAGAGFHPLERSAPPLCTRRGAGAPTVGSANRQARRPGGGRPIRSPSEVLYGTGTWRRPTTAVRRRLRWTIKDGIVYDAPTAADVRAGGQARRPELPLPGRPAAPATPRPQIPARTPHTNPQRQPWTRASARR